jgi:hypothetical protein
MSYAVRHETIIRREAEHAAREREREREREQSSALLSEADLVLAQAREAEVTARHWRRIYLDREKGG